MWRLVSNRSNSYGRFRFVHIIENTIFPAAQLPDRIHVLPGRYEPSHNLAVTSLSRWLMTQLYFNSVQDPRALVRAQTSEIISDVFRKCDFVQSQEIDSAHLRRF
jgi:hypothetical protein